MLAQTGGDSQYSENQNKLYPIHFSLRLLVNTNKYIQERVSGFR